MSRITIMTDRLKSPRTRAEPGNVSVCAADKMADWHTDVLNFAQATELLLSGRPLQGGSGPHLDQRLGHQGPSAVHLRSTKDIVSTDVLIRQIA